MKSFILFSPFRWKAKVLITFFAYPKCKKKVLESAIEALDSVEQYKQIINSSLNVSTSYLQIA